MYGTSAGGITIALYHTAQGFFATGNTCPHRGGPMGEGELEGHIAFCPWHGWRFDVVTGINDLDESSKIASYRVIVEGTQLFVEVPDEWPGGNLGRPCP